MMYEKPDVRDFGSLSDHTFGGTNPGGESPRKDTRLCTKDNFLDESCPTP